MLNEILEELKMFSVENIMNPEKVSQSYFANKFNYFQKRLNGLPYLSVKSQYGLTIYYMSYDNTKVTISFYSEAFFNYEKDLKVISVGFNSNPKYTDFTIEKYMGE